MSCCGTKVAVGVRVEHFGRSCPRDMDRVAAEDLKFVGGG